MQRFDPSAPPEQFAAALRAMDRRRAAFFHDQASGTLLASEPWLQPVADALAGNARDFDAHEAVLLELGQETGALLAAFVHRSVRGQPQGGVRHWSYASLGALLDDGLRLARGMGRKNALAGLWWGGGKGIIAQQPQAPVNDRGYRTRLYQDYGRFITGLRGAYVTAEDVGTGPEDMAAIYQSTRFVTCVPPGVGGSGNPSDATARGVVAAMEAAWLYRSEPGLSERDVQQRLGDGRSVLQGRRIAMQGSGNVARFMVGHLLERGVASIVAAEISQAACEEARQRFPDPRFTVRKVDPQDRSIFAEPCDIFAPNALGGVLHPETIALLQAPVVCGAANNQLLDDARDAALLQQRGILAVPDYLANRMGIVNCANEQYGSLPDDPAIQQHFDPGNPGSVQRVAWQVLERSARSGSTPVAAAHALADERAMAPHPVWPGRTRQLLQALQAEGWAQG